MKIEKLSKWEVQEIFQSLPFLERFDPSDFEKYRVRGTSWVFHVGTNWSGIWPFNTCSFAILDFSKSSRPAVSFEQFFDVAPVEVQECLAFHPDLFRD